CALGDLLRTIPAAVVGDQHFTGNAGAAQEGARPFDAAPDGRCFVQTGHEDGELEALGHHAALPANGPRRQRSFPIIHGLPSRLSIIDLSAAANQPMWDASRRLLIVINGEIYNFRDLRGELEQRGVHFRTSSDTEVVLEAYRCWGVDFIARLNGMFAFALWDEPR